MAKTFGLLSLTKKDSNGNVVAEISGNPIAAYLESADIDFGDRKALKYIDALLAEISELQQGDVVQLQIGHRESVNDDFQWSDLFTVNDGIEPIFMRYTDRYYKIRIRSEASGVFWRLVRLQWYGTTHGRRI